MTNLFKINTTDPVVLAKAEAVAAALAQVVEDRSKLGEASKAFRAYANVAKDNAARLDDLFRDLNEAMAATGSSFKAVDGIEEQVEKLEDVLLKQEALEARARDRHALTMSEVQNAFGAVLSDKARGAIFGGLGASGGGADIGSGILGALLGSFGGRGTAPSPTPSAPAASLESILPPGHPFLSRQRGEK